MPTSDELSRMQPQYSPGERLATIEALLAGLDRRFDDMNDLFEEKLDGVRREIDAKSTAQKEAVEKAEKATGRQFETFIEGDSKRSEVTQTRLAALERGESIGQGAERAKSAISASTIGWGSLAVGVITVLIYVIAYIPH